MKLYRCAVLSVVLPFAWIGALYAQTSSTPTTPPAASNENRTPPVEPVEPAAAPSTQGNEDRVGKDAGGQYTLRTEAYEVLLNVTVLDSAGREAQNLRPKSFQISEDGVAQRISSFRHEDLPVSIGLLVDNSASMYDKRIAVEKTALDLIRLSNPKDEAFVVNFNSRAYLDQDFSSSIEKLQHGLRQVSSTGETAAYDAVMVSAQYLSKHAKNTKQVLLLVTDGADTVSKTSLTDTIARIRKLDGPVVYCIGLLFGTDIEKDEAKHARDTLQRMADQTGGAAFFPRDLNQIDSIAAIIADDIRSQYTIGYRPTNPPSNGGYRAVHIDAVGPKSEKLNVRTRSGYLARGSNIKDSTALKASASRDQR